ncbi:MAG: Alpha-D-ribose 1-methylphosphonate 5-triphosphate synthase subunit PhnG [Gammaproteobacteria bacterium]|jgi:alpha-D-ribose 1-methylphosphonate 5-triphosphate synthase subunit PhnG|nr:MAG: Alpha-D-ribose 1-methylphosphonate 5-triphosphate synthase subunit PhnG [Gammaproteobacteria bacterium]
MVSRFSAENKLREARRDWLATLVRVPANEVIEAANGFDFNVVTLKGPEVGLLMTNGRIHSTGRPFHLGEVSLTKCVLRDGQGLLGYGHIIGRNKQQARAIALFDLALQRDDSAEAALTRLNAWGEEIAEIDAMESEAVEETRVDFFTMVRGES